MFFMCFPPHKLLKKSPAAVKKPFKFSKNAKYRLFLKWTLDHLPTTTKPRLQKFPKLDPYGSDLFLGTIPPLLQIGRKQGGE